MAQSAAARAEARFKQLCCLGLGGEAVMPALLEQLHAIVPSFSSAFFFADEKGGLARCYDENPDTVPQFPLWSEVFFNKRDREVPGHSFAAAMHQVGVHDLESATSTSPAAFRRTDMYNLILLPCGRGTSFVRLTVRDRGHGLGLILVYRSPRDEHFTRSDKRRLAGLEAFFVHALRDRSQTEDSLAESGRSGLIIADQAGRPLFFSREGRHLLFLAMHPNNGRLAALPPPLTRICRSLTRVFSGDSGAAAPVYQHRNVWGGFTFRAHWLKGNDPAPGLIGIQVSHQEPLAASLVRRVAGLPLTGREAQVCVHLAKGSSNETIAEQLGISKHTVITHGRTIYEKLDVHNRAELLDKLLFPRQ
jgi:DNA-binding CsgD family transcriptional regulator